MRAKMETTIRDGWERRDVTRLVMRARGLGWEGRVIVRMHPAMLRYAAPASRAARRGEPVAFPDLVLVPDRACPRNRATAMREAGA